MPGAVERWALIGGSGGEGEGGRGWAWRRTPIGSSSRGRGGAGLLGAGCLERLELRALIGGSGGGWGGPGRGCLVLARRRQQ